MNIRESIRKSYLFKILVRIFYKLLRKYSLHILEPLGIDTYSKPYSIESIEYHNNILNEFNYLNGFFIEIGGFDGFFHSPTYYLEKFKNWNGILVEPNPFFANTRRKNRKASKVYNVACVSSDYKDDKIEFNNCSHSTHVIGSASNNNWVQKALLKVSPDRQKFIASAKSLTKILDDYFVNREHCIIDLFVLDVEEYELDVLKGLDFFKYCPKNILVECHTKNYKQGIERYLISKGYFCKKLISHQDYLFSKS